MKRLYLHTMAPDVPMVIFLDQIAYVSKKGQGSVIRTSDGTDHNFYSVSYEKMLINLGITSEEA